MRNGDKERSLRDTAEVSFCNCPFIRKFREFQKITSAEVAINCLRYVCALYMYMLYICVYFGEKFSKMMEGVNDFRRVLVCGQ